MDQLLALVRSPSIDAVEGGMRVLSDFVSISLTEDQLLPIARDMLPTLLTILGSPQVRFRFLLNVNELLLTLNRLHIDLRPFHSSSSDPHLPTMRNDFIHGERGTP